MVAAALAALVLPVLAGAQVVETRELMPGVVYTKDVRRTAAGPLVVHTIVAPRPGGLYALKPVLSNDRILGRETVSAMQQRIELEGTTAGVNGDLFTWDTGRPSGILVRNGVVDGRPNPGRSTLGIGLDGLLRVMRIQFFGSWRVADGESSPLDQINKEIDPEGDEVALFTPAWGDRTPRVKGALDVVLAAFPAATPDTDLTGQVVLLRRGGGTPIPAGGAVVQATGIRATQLQIDAPPGAAITIRLTLKPWWQDVPDAIGGGPVIVRDGQAVVGDEEFDSSQLSPRNPRTAVGQLADGRIVLVAVDGRSRSSRGVRIWDLARELVRQGAVTAMALDAGGSTTIAFDGTVLNTPSDGSERPVANALMVFYYGAFLPEPRYALVSPNGDGVAEREEGLEYKVVRPSTVDAKLLAPDGSIVWQEQAVRDPGVYPVPEGELVQQGTYTWTIAATDDQGLPSTMTRTFTVNPTLGFFRLSKRFFKPRLGRTVDVSFRLANPAKVNVLVLNLAGRAVRRLYGKRAEPGDLVLTWDGRNNRGRLLAPGTYTVRVKAGNALGVVADARSVDLRK
jgi:hypothetical protein